MSGPSWFKCDPQALNDGFMGLSASERGAYMTVLNCIYLNGGPVKDAAGYFCSMLGCTPKEWASWRRTLLRLSKLRAVDIGLVPHLTNLRAEREIASYAANVANAKRAAAASLKARGVRPRNRLKLVDD